MAYTFIGVVISIFLVMGGLIGSVLIFKQNDLLNTQNERIDLQNNLLEAERRSSLIFLMSNVLDKVDDEIKEQRDDFKRKLESVPDSVKYSLSKPLISRIVALSRSLRPYRMMEGDTLSELVSPERGQLFISLMENGLDSLTQNTIMENGDFSYTVIGKIDLSGAELSQANLRGAYLHETNLVWADLIWADLSRAIGLEKELLAQTRTLYNCKNLPSELEAALKKEKPCLFTKEGCLD